MSRLEIKAEGDDVAADKMLTLATLMLRLLKRIERQQRKDKGEKSRKTLIRWRVDIQSGFAYGLIALRAEAPDGQVDSRIHQATSQAIMQEAIRRSGE